MEKVEKQIAGEDEEQKEEDEEEEAEGGGEAEEEDEEVEEGEGEEQDEEGRGPNPQQTKDVAMRNGDDEAAAAAAGSDGEAANRPSDAPASEEDSGPHGEKGKVFIGGLTWETTTEMLTSHFNKYGAMTDSVIMKNRATGHPRGFGFVTFANPSVLDTVLKDNHVIDGRMVEVKRTVPRDKMSGASKGVLKTKKIFVGGLTTSTTEAELKAYFSKFGKVLEHQIMQDHSSGRSRGFGFVTFESEQAVEVILTQGRMHELDGKQVEIKKAEPKRADQEPPASGGGGRSGYPAGRGGGYGANTGLYGVFNGGDAYYGGGGYGRGGGRSGGYPYGGPAYGYGGGFGAPYGYADAEYGMGYNYASYGSGSGYGFNYGSGYGSGSRGYGNGRYHPYDR